jgi:Immunoglobulin domain
VDIGGNVKFECQVRSFPRPIIKWYKDDVEVPPTSSEGDTDVVSRVQAEDLTGLDSSTEGLLRLVIRDARKEDEGAYRCKAENEEGVAATTGYLSVTGRICKHDSIIVCNEVCECT